MGLNKARKDVCAIKKLKAVIGLVVVVLLHGCATVPMGSLEDDSKLKEFGPPSAGHAGLYIYRNSALGAALKKSVYIDGQLLGETAVLTYFYKEVQPGTRVLSTESEFSNNDFLLEAESGKNYFINQYIRIGLFVGGANLRLVPDAEGKNGVLQCKLAKAIDTDAEH